MTTQLTWLDLLVGVFVLGYALAGTRRGFLLGVIDLVGTAATILAALHFYGPAVAWLTKNVSALPVLVTDVLALLGLIVLAQAVFGLAAGVLVRLLYPVLLAVRPLFALDRLLGLVPGLVRGLVLATLLLLPFALVPILPAFGRAIEESQLASRLVGVGLLTAPEIEDRLGNDLATGLSRLILAPPEPQEGIEGGRLQVGPLGTLTPDPSAEQQMLDLVNAERAREGLRPLVADDALREIARAHSQEMFERGYFAHDSPTAGSPYDRMRAARIPFLRAGENLAYAANVQTAHQGLMRSPGHRANILRSEFGRVGIGVIRSQFQGSMFTQDFRN